MQGSGIVIPEWFWIVFLFAFGCCVGSFLNVVIYRLPRDKSLVSPPSSCPACGRHIYFYDNIPLVSWLLLGGKCRFCKAPISPRYFVIELLTGLLFIGLFFLYFRSGMRAGIPTFINGGWLIYLLPLIMLSGFIAASAIDLELWIIPLSICWFVTGAGLVGSAIAPLVIDPEVINQYLLTPSTSGILLGRTTIASLSAGALIGLAVSYLLLATGLIKRSYDLDPIIDSANQQQSSAEQPDLNDRVEVCREILFLLPVVVCSIAAYWFVKRYHLAFGWWADFSQIPVIAGLLGGLWGYFVGCGIVWATRIFGTLAFGKEAMGLGDVHLMGAAGTVIGPLFVTMAFFIAPFFGLIWAGVQMFSKKTRQIPYGPFLSLGVLAVIILHDRIMGYVSFLFYG
jgi:leader peptidase (prepilin peptidase)/N-methyltransferase